MIPSQDVSSKYIEDISTALKSDQQVYKFPYSLYIGKAGHTLFYNQFSPKEQPDKYVDKLIDQLINDVLNENNLSFTFCAGLSGTLWLFDYLQKYKRTDLEEDFFTEIDNLVFIAANKCFDKFNYDFLHGGLGMIFTLLKRPVANKNKIESLVRQLLALRTTFRGYPIWRYVTYETETKNDFQICFGLAHGIPSLMVILSKVYTAGIMQNECAKAISDCYNLLHTFRNNAQNRFDYSFYPSIYIEGVHTIYKTRLGWCYGDLSIAMGLYVTGTNLNSEKMVSEALSIFEYYESELNEPRYCVRDSMICHGAAGVALLYYRMYCNTQKNSFRQTAQRWLDIVLSMANHESGLANYKFYKGDERGWENNTTLLEGIAGVGIVLSTINSNDIPTWDECFLLS